MGRLWRLFDYEELVSLLQLTMRLFNFNLICAAILCIWKNWCYNLMIKFTQIQSIYKWKFLTCFSEITKPSCLISLGSSCGGIVIILIQPSILYMNLMQNGKESIELELELKLKVLV